MLNIYSSVCLHAQISEEMGDENMFFFFVVVIIFNEVDNGKKALTDIVGNRLFPDSSVKVPQVTC